MDDTRKKIDELLEESEKFAKANDDLLNIKTDVTLNGLGILLSLIETHVKELFEGMAQTQYFDKGLGDKIQGAVSSAITAFTQVKHEINFAPQITFDTAPFQKIVTDALSENKRIYSLVEKMNNGGGNNEKLNELVLMMINKHNQSLEKDYMPQFLAVMETLNKPHPNLWKGKVTKRTVGGVLNGALEEFEIEAVNNK